MFWGELREEEFDVAIKECNGVCVIPIGCYEMHGEHLPVYTDVLEAEAIVREAQKLEPMCVFPSFRFGNVSGHVDWKGAVRLEPKLMLELLENLCDEISRNGFKKIMLVNYHGGNTDFLKFFISSLAYKKKDYIVAASFPYAGIGPRIKDIWERIQKDGSGVFPELLPEDEETIDTFIREEKTDGHAGLNETCLVMAERPDLVRLDRMSVVSGLSTHEGDSMRNPSLYTAAAWCANHPSNYDGHDPVGASERIGKCILRLSAENVAESVRTFKTAKGIEEYLMKKQQYYPE